MLCLAASFYLVARRDPYRTPAPAGVTENSVRQLVLSSAPVERRYTGLFKYFADGFVRHASPGYSRVQFAGARSFNGYSNDGLEGFARTGTLLAAWVHTRREGSDRFAEILREGILGGVDPHSDRYWGDIHDYDQRIVEAADVARILWLTRASIWDSLKSDQKQMVSAWLRAATTKHTPLNNWILFPVVISLTLVSLNGETSPELVSRAHAKVAAYRRFALDRGWFYDPPHGVDFYNAWGIAFDLFWIHTLDPAFEPEFIERALGDSAELTQHLISPQGLPIMGRSVCYRTAVPAPLIAATFLESGRFPAGRALRGLDVVWRYFVTHDSLRDGTLTQGYFGTDLRFLDRYSGTGSCGWGLRSLVLAFMHPAGDEFWSAAEQPLPVEEGDYHLELPKLGWTVDGRRAGGEITLTLEKNLHDVHSVEAYPWLSRALDLFSGSPHRPENYAIKYDSQHYASAAPFPLEN
jgi:hypothetical protein